MTEDKDKRSEVRGQRSNCELRIADFEFEPYALCSMLYAQNRLKT
jgi:hypothetical protein